MKSTLTVALTKAVLGSLADLLHGPRVSASDAGIGVVGLQRPDLILKPDLPAAGGFGRILAGVLFSFTEEGNSCPRNTKVTSIELCVH